MKAGVGVIRAVRAQKIRERVTKKTRIYPILRYWTRMVILSQNNHLWSQKCEKVNKKIASLASMPKTKMRVDLHSLFQTVT